MTVRDIIGDSIYDVIHAKLRRENKKPKKCSTCKTSSRRIAWANITGIYDTNIKNYVALCASCHNRLDKSGSWDICKNGHKMTDENTYIRPSGFLECRKCRVKNKKLFDMKAKKKNLLITEEQLMERAEKAGWKLYGRSVPSHEYGDPKDRQKAQDKLDLKLAIATDVIFQSLKQIQTQTARDCIKMITKVTGGIPTGDLVEFAVSLRKDIAGRVKTKYNLGGKANG